MSQSDSLVQSYETELNQLKDTVNMNLQSIASNSQSAALNLTGATGAITTAKTIVETSLNRIAQMTNAIDAATKQISLTAKASGAAYASSQSQVNTLKDEVTQNKTLSEIRKAQADSLKQKYFANNHTSYLGLWRPLSEDTRVALFVLSIVLGLFSIITVYFLMKDNWSTLQIPSLFGAPAAKQPPRTLGALFGGVRRVFQKTA